MIRIITIHDPHPVQSASHQLRQSAHDLKKTADETIKRLRVNGVALKNVTLNGKEKS